MFHKKWTRKKKSLTDFVTLINFPGQGEKKTTNKPTQETTPTVSYGSFSTKKEVKTLDQPTGNIHTNLLSIKDLSKPKSSDKSLENINIDNKPKTNFSLDDLKIHWRKFAFKMKNEGNDTIYLAMVKRDPKVTSDFVILHEVDNQVQIDYIQTHISELIDYLRENLKNWAIQISFSINESIEENIQLQTGKDKFNALARKNVNLYTLQKTFNLDIEY